MSYTFVDYAWFFLIYAFLGWCTEVAYKAVTSGKFRQQGIFTRSAMPHLWIRNDFAVDYFSTNQG